MHIFISKVFSNEEKITGTKQPPRHFLLFLLCLFISINLIAQPVISAFSPTSATAGTTVNITGTNFTGATSVSFGGTKAYSFQVISATAISALVANGSTGNVSVTTPSGTVSLNGFSFIANPAVTSFAPTNGPVGTTVTITGNHFSSNATENIVYFGSVKAIVTSAEITQLSVKVPAGGTHQYISVLNTVTHLNGSSSKPFITTFNGGATGKTSITTSSDQNKNFAVGEGPSRIVSGDLDGDGKPELVTANYYSNSISILKNTSVPHTIDSISFAPKMDMYAGQSTKYVQLIDINGDGKLDIIAGSINNFTISVFQNTSAPGQVSMASPVVFNNMDADFHVGDVDGDGRPDLIQASYQRMTIRRNLITDGNINSGSFGQPVLFLADFYIGPIEMADLDEDGKPEVIAGESEGTRVAVFKNTSKPGIITDTSLAHQVNFSINPGATALSVADMDGDNKPDIIATGRPGTVAILRNISTPGSIDNTSFTSAASFQTNDGSVALDAADIDGDGKNDIAVANYISKTISLLKNNAFTGNIDTLSLTKKTDVTAGYAPYGISVVDADGDGKPELAVINFGDNNVSILKPILITSPPQLKSVNPAFGGSGSSVTLTGKYFTHATSASFGNIEAASFRVLTDTSVTAIVGAGASGNITIATPLGTSTMPGFTFIPAPKITSFSPVEATTGDSILIKGTNFNLTKKVSLGSDTARAFTVISDTTISAVSGRGASGNITVETPYGSGTIAGFSFYKKPEIISFSPNLADEGTVVTIRGTSLIGVTSVTFGNIPAKSFTLMSDTAIMAIAGKGETGDIAVNTLHGTVTIAGFTYIHPAPVITSFSPGSGPVNSTVTINGTNFNSSVAGNIVFFGAVRATVLAATPATLSVKVPAGATYQPISVTTYNLTAYTAKPFIPTFTANIADLSPYSFSPKIDFVTGNNPTGVAIGDVNTDGKPDLVIANKSSYTVSVILNKSSGKKLSFDPKIDYSSQVSQQVVISDIDGDGKPDLVIGNNNDGAASTLFKNTGLKEVVSFDAGITLSYPLMGGFHVTSGDFDGDGRPDIAIASIYGQLLSVFRNTTLQGKISFASRVDYATGSLPYSVTSGDVDGDGKVDILVTNYYSGSVSIYKNTCTSGSISFAPKIDFSTTSYQRSIQMGDLDGDGKPDIVVNSDHSIFILRNTSTPGAISVAPAVEFAVGLDPLSIAIGDINGDAQPDIAVANSTSNTVSIIKNTSTTGTISFAAKQDFATGIAPESVCIGDLDGDGKPDLAVANASSNTVSILRNQIGEPIEVFLCAAGSTVITSDKTGSNYQWQVCTGSGYINIAANANYSGTNTITLRLNNIPSLWYGYKYRCIVDGKNSDEFTLKFTDNWNGSVSTAWEDPANWNCSAIPDANTDVIINRGALILNSNTTVRSLTIAPGASLTVSSGYKLTIAH